MVRCGATVVHLRPSRPGRRLTRRQRTPRPARPPARPSCLPHHPSRPVPRASNPHSAAPLKTNRLRHPPHTIQVSSSSTPDLLLYKRTTEYVPLHTRPRHLLPVRPPRRTPSRPSRARVASRCRCACSPRRHHRTGASTQSTGSCVTASVCGGVGGVMRCRKIGTDRGRQRDLQNAIRAVVPVPHTEPFVLSARNLPATPRRAAPRRAERARFPPRSIPRQLSLTRRVLIVD